MKLNPPVNPGERALLEAQFLAQQLKYLDEQLKQISMAILELGTAYATITNLQTGKALMPIGASCLLQGEITSNTVYVAIGSNYFAPMSPDNAAALLKQRMEELDEGSKAMKEEKKKIESRLRELEQMLRSQGNNDVRPPQG